ncbi:shikimate dehydrogenase [Bacillaceae bacterium S4-13-58]
MSLFLGLVGNPVHHSRSPWIHHYFLKQMSLDGGYHLFELKENEFEEGIRAMKLLGIHGFNVTVPYKEKILPFLDELTPIAARVGAVNTVVHQNGKWIGHNTDGEGFLASLRQSYKQVNNESKILLLGAGGASRGIYGALTHHLFSKVDIANRSVPKMESLKEMKKDTTDTQILSLKEAEEKVGEYDVIIQTTSVGMGKGSKDQIISLHNVSSKTIVCDIVYQPIETAFLKEAKRLNAQVLTGHGMLIYQAALAFEQWTGKNVDATPLVKELELILRGEQKC